MDNTDPAETTSIVIRKGTHRRLAMLKLILNKRSYDALLNELLDRAESEE